MILFRWIHIATASVMVGGVFFLTIVFPIGLRALDAQPARAMLLRTRRVFKMVVHSAILLMLVSGTYNAVLNWPKYTALGPAVGHSLFGTHLLLALIAFGILLWIFVGKEPRRYDQKWLAITLGVLFLTIAAASVLKFAKDAHATQPIVDFEAVPP